MATENNKNNNESSSSPHPRLPELYFADCDSCDGHNDNDNNAEEANTTTTMNNNNNTVQLLPPELLQHTVDYLDWGDLCKVSVVKKSWSNIVNDAAEFGGHDGKWELAVCLLEGSNGLQKNPKRALKLLKELAQIEIANHTAATNNDDSDDTATNDDHDEGNDHHDVDDEEEETMIELISENDEVEEEESHSTPQQPFAPAMKLVADCYLTGNGITKDNKMGIKWLEAAHNKGNDADSAHKLALMYEYGEHGTDLDVYMAADWFHKAALAGHIEAMAEYAMCCELGCGVDQSDENAMEWYMKAAEAGHVTANYSVGEAFEEARGVPQSDEEACLWYYKAACEGDEDSKKALRRLHDIARIVVPGVGSILNV